MINQRVLASLAKNLLGAGAKAEPTLISRATPATRLVRPPAPRPPLPTQDRSGIQEHFGLGPQTPQLPTAPESFVSKYKRSRGVDTEQLKDEGLFRTLKINKNTMQPLGKEMTSIDDVATINYSNAELHAVRGDKNAFGKLSYQKLQEQGFTPPGGKAQDLPQILRGTKGLTADNIMKTHPNIKLTRDVPATDIYGNKVKIPEGERLTPYELKGNKILLQDGETYLVSRNQFDNIKGNSIGGEAKPFAPELKGLEESLKGGRDLEGEIDGIIKDMARQGATGFTRREAKDYILQNPEVFNIAPKYSQYTLLGGKKYREILIKAPEVKGKTPVSRAEFERSMREDGMAGDYEDYLKEFNKGNALGYGNFKSSHWREPNVISHLRINDRTYKGKKVTFMEEL